MKLLNLRWRRDEDGEPILEKLVWDDGKRVRSEPLPLPPYFFVEEKNKDLALEVAERRGIDARAERGNYETADTHKKAVKIEVTAPSDVPKIRDVLEARGIRCYEADLPYAQKRVLIDKQWSIAQPDNNKILFFDIEVDARLRFPRAENPDQRIILILARDMDGREFIFDDRDEEELLRRFLQTAYRYQVICGYNIDNFDTPYILARAKVLGIEIDPFLFPGYDWLALYREIFKRKQESYSLASVSKRILGIELEDWGADSADKVRRMYEMWERGGEELKKLHAYTRSQVDANVKLEEKLRLIPMRAMICGRAHLWPYTFPRQYQRASIIENLVLSRQVEREKDGLTRFVFPSRSEEGEKESYVGGFVMDPPRGVIENVAVLDLVSIYPAIIMAFNIGFETWREDKSGEILAPHGSFVKEPRSSVAEMLSDLIELRMHYKKLRNQYHPDSTEYKIYDGMQFGVKFIINASYGVLGFEKSRLYRWEIAENITLYARSILNYLRHYFTSLGYRVVYSDTDSVFVHKRNIRNIGEWVDELERELEEFRDRMRQWAAVVYNSPYTDVLDIKIDRVAVKAYFSGKKKRYALLSVYEDDEFIAPYIHTKGFELVRGDAVKIAKRVQEDLLRMLLTGREKEIPHYLKEMKRRVMNGEFDDDLFLLKQVTKPLDEYVNPPPHVRAAQEYERRGMQIRPGDKVQYLWDGKNIKIRGETLTAADRARVWEHQVVPILERLGVDELSQMKLSDFWSEER